MGPSPNRMASLQSGKLGRRHRQQEGGAETGREKPAAWQAEAIQLEAKRHQAGSRNGRLRRNGPAEPERAQPCQHLDLPFLPAETGEKQFPTPRRGIFRLLPLVTIPTPEIFSKVFISIHCCTVLYLLTTFPYVYIMYFDYIQPFLASRSRTLSQLSPSFAATPPPTPLSPRSVNRSA